jgi:hypothetical protein
VHRERWQAPVGRSPDILRRAKPSRIRVPAVPVTRVNFKALEGNVHFCTRNSFLCCFSHFFPPGRRSGTKQRASSVRSCTGPSFPHLPSPPSVPFSILDFLLCSNLKNLAFKRPLCIKRSTKSHASNPRAFPWYEEKQLSYPQPSSTSNTRPRATIRW